IEGLGGGRGTATPLPSGATPGPTGTPGASPTPGSSSVAGGSASSRPPARDELWVPIVLIALIALMAEWLVYQRDSVTRLWRSARGRLRPVAPAATPGGGASPGSTRRGA
ncbi:MAG: hypothetical protein ABIV26_02950, partial [Candidatus Limnocylindrales bacterium]